MSKHTWPAPVFDIGHIISLAAPDTSGKVLRALSPETRIIATTLLGEVDKLRYWRHLGNHLTSAQIETLTDLLDTAIHEIIYDVDVIPLGEDGCFWLPARHGAIRWYPNNPYSGNAASFNYPFPDEQLQIKWDSPDGWLEETFLSLLGIQPGDALCYWSLFFGDASEYDDTSFEGVGLPYASFKFSSTAPGILQLHFLEIPYGGIAATIVDGNLLSTTIKNLATDPLEVADPELGAADVVALSIDELSFDAGEHEIYVYFSPFVQSSPPWLLFGGGLRGIRICTTGDLTIGYEDGPVSEEITTILAEIRDGLIPCTCSLLEQITKLLKNTATGGGIVDRFDTKDLLKDKIAGMKIEHGTLGDALQFANFKNKTAITDTSAIANAAICRAVKWFIRHHLIAIQDYYRANPLDALYYSRELTFDTGIRASIPNGLNQRMLALALTVWPTEDGVRIFECKMYSYLLNNPEINNSTAGITNWRYAVQAGYSFLQPTNPTTEQIAIGECLLQLCLPVDNYLIFMEYLNDQYDTLLASSFADSDDCSCVMLPGGDDSYEFLLTGEGWAAENEATTYQPATDHPSNGGWQKASALVQDTCYISRVLDTPRSIERVQITMAFYNQYTIGRTITVRLLDAQSGILSEKGILLPTNSGENNVVRNIYFDQTVNTYAVEIEIYNGLNTMFIEHVGIYYND